MKLEKERIIIANMGRELLQQGFTKGTGGNLSIFNSEEKIFAITPSGIPYKDIEPEDICVMDLDGKKLEGKRVPSSELEMHRLVYENRSDIKAMIHAHTLYSTAVSCLGEKLPAVHYMIGLVGNDIRTAKYATYGTRELAENALESMEGRLAVLLQNHGILVGGSSLDFCLNALDEIEYVARLYLLTRASGEPIILPDEEMDRVREKFKSYGK